ncbi:phosphotransferase [Nocardioides sp. zg-1228]|uniref:phosphotransferase n=1 Tax=Nocardioides sp. zg-1228 TaxID=2763008 RepID=UPI0016432997|nr:phosphotransferase [Nocardioides sp. zg-1228]MBC2934836.1 phosphotransferase [Nocardioides sp. zg-1228]QSF58374.1 phosphotransferase [Nocardioides sp. zg-1228]
MSQLADRWRDPAFLDAAHAWIHEQLDTTAPVVGIEQTHVTDWSTVLRVTTGAGQVWFKANDDTMRHEAAVTGVVAARSAGRVPAPLASDPGTGWMLLADAGPRLREVVPLERSLDRWHDVLDAYARVQLACEDEVDTLLALGLPDRRLHTLPAAYADLLAGLDGADPRLPDASLIAELCDRLAAHGIRETVQHDDLHDGQVFLGDGVHQVLDWGDACVSHPFFTLSVTLEGVIAWGVDDEAGSEDLEPHLAAYLRPYEEHYGRTDLRDAAALAMRLGWVCRAINGALPQDPGSTRTRLKMFLDARP